MKTASDKSVQALVAVAVAVAEKAAREYLRTHGLKSVDPDAAGACLKSWIMHKLPGAMKDAKDALDCGMKQIAETTFRASMALAGIEAAKEFGVPA